MNEWEHEVRLERLLGRGIDARILQGLRTQRNLPLLVQLEQIIDEDIPGFNRMFAKQRASNTVYCVTSLGPSDDTDKLVVAAELQDAPVNLGPGFRMGHAWGVG